MLQGRLLIAGLACSLVAFTTVASAQQQPSTTRTPATGVQQSRLNGPDRNGMQRRAAPPLLRRLRRLNLSDAQKQQVRSIMQTNRESTRAQRQELRQLTLQWRQGTLAQPGLARANELRKQLREDRIALRAQIVGVLTPEQKQNLEKLEEMIKARRADRNSRRLGQRPG